MSIIEKALDKLDTALDAGAPVRSSPPLRTPVPDQDADLVPSLSDADLRDFEAEIDALDHDPASSAAKTLAIEGSAAEVDAPLADAAPRVERAEAQAPPSDVPVVETVAVDKRASDAPVVEAVVVDTPAGEASVVEAITAGTPANDEPTDGAGEVTAQGRPEPGLGDLAELEGEPVYDSTITAQNVELDYQALAAVGVITPETSQSGMAEQVRIIKRPLLLRASLGRDAKQRYDGEVPATNIIQVTSALPSEGKTFTSINLAMSMAMELDRTVLLIDADSARSDVARILGIEAEEGLSDYLTRKTKPLSEYLVRTDMPSLSVLPAGRHYANMTELLASKDMLRMIEELATRYSDRIVLLDSAPLLATSGASVIAHLVGQIVLVVEAIRTPQSAVRDALRILEGIGHDNVGIVLNKSRDPTPGGYGYGYYFGSKK